MLTSRVSLSHLEDLLPLVSLLLDPVLVLPLRLLPALGQQPGEVGLGDGPALPDIIVNFYGFCY